MKAFMQLITFIALNIISMSASAEDINVILCNSSPVKIFSAVGYTNNHGWQARGWYSIEPGKCIEPNVETSNRYIYFHAHSNTPNLEWSGKYSFCTRSPDAFHLSDSDNCSNSNKFSKADAGNAKIFTYTFSCGSSCQNTIVTDEYYDTGEKLHIYGNWCGPGHPKGLNPGAPINQIDKACFNHDRRYANCEKADNKLECEANADARLMSDLATMSLDQYLDPKRLVMTSSIISYFILQSTAKYSLGTARNIRKEADRVRDRLSYAGARVANDLTRKTNNLSNSISNHLNNVASDIKYGPNENNDIVGRKGWLRQRLGF